MNLTDFSSQTIFSMIRLKPSKLNKYNKLTTTICLKLIKDLTRSLNVTLLLLIPKAMSSPNHSGRKSNEKSSRKGGPDSKATSEDKLDTKNLSHINLTEWIEFRDLEAMAECHLVAGYLHDGEVTRPVAPEPPTLPPGAITQRTQLEFTL
jgi:hypothetical protein